ncbi:MAG: ATP-binding protein [Neisseria sp.]|nr:ATP-binding protein [Neisseria sp.]
MKAFWWQFAGGWFLLIVLALFGYGLGGATGLFAAWALGSTVWLLLWACALLRLCSHLVYPKIYALPESGGVWGGIFRIIGERERSRKRRKRKLSQALTRFRQAAEALPDGVVLLDKNDKIIWLNSSAAEHWQAVFGIGRNKGWHSDALTGFLLGGEVECRLQTVSSGRAVSLEVSFLSFGGERLLLTRDVSESERLNVMRTAFVANVSHELRTPLTVLNGFLETLADYPDLPQAQAQEFVALMQHEGRRMQQLLDDLLTLSALEAGRGAEMAEIDFSGLAEEISAAGKLLSDGLHEWVEDIEPDVVLKGVRQELYAALSNLVFNAVRYTPEGGRIAVQLKQMPSANPFAGPDIVFAVEDDGIGIAAEHLPHLTERFYRADAGRSRDTGGTGLGLAICKHVLTRHGTALQIESEVGHGSRFSARFRADGEPCAV